MLIMIVYFTCIGIWLPID